MQHYTIVFVTNNYTPYAGGVVSSLMAFRHALSMRGHRVYIVTLDFNGAHDDEEGVMRIYCPIKFFYKDNPMALPLRATQQIYDIIAQLKPDIVHSQHPFLLGNAAQRACKKLDVPLVFTYHTQYDKYAHYVPLPERVMVPMVNRLVHNYCRQCALIITPTNSIKKQLSTAHLPAPIHIIPSPILPLFAQALPQPVEKKRAEKFRLLSVSRFVPEKNITSLLDMVAQLNNVAHSLTLIGYGYYQAMLERYAYGWHALSHDAVTFIVKPPKDLLRDYYLQSDAFVFTSQSETQGIVLAEAMACGTPVIALHGSGQDDVVVNGVNGFLVDDIAQMREAVALLAHDQSLCVQLQQGAWQTGQRYHADVLAAQLLEQYQSVLKSEQA